MVAKKLLTDKEIKEIFGNFTYHDRPDGIISIDKNWLCKNISSCRHPLVGKFRCHNLIKNKLIEVFDEIAGARLSGFIDHNDTSRRGGCFFARHINMDINMPLSRHCWGIAIDINPSTNEVGTKGGIDSRIVDIFEKYDFAWGGMWDIPDPMHFEFAQYI